MLGNGKYQAFFNRAQEFHPDLLDRILQRVEAEVLQANSRYGVLYDATGRLLENEKLDMKAFNRISEQMEEALVELKTLENELRRLKKFKKIYEKKRKK